MRQPWAALVVPAKLDGRTVELFCELLTQLNLAWLEEHPETPPLAKSGVWYETIPEYWMTIPFAIARAREGSGVDCKVLAAWRAAEVRYALGDRRARCKAKPYVVGTLLLFHVTVVRGDGTEEDPSAVLGMTSLMPAQVPPHLLEAHQWNQ